jgi:hypothetical protein
MVGSGKEKQNFTREYSKNAQTVANELFHHEKYRRKQ